jgi:hypothetical protein
LLSAKNRGTDDLCRKGLQEIEGLAIPLLEVETEIAELTVIPDMD